MGLAYLFSILASTLVVMPLSPVLCAILLANQNLPHEGTFVSRLAERIYRLLLGFSMRAPQIILALALVALVASAAVVPSLGRVFLPEFQEKSLVNSMVLFPGISLEITVGAGKALANSLMFLASRPTHIAQSGFCCFLFLQPNDSKFSRLPSLPMRIVAIPPAVSHAFEQP